MEFSANMSLKGDRKAAAMDVYEESFFEYVSRTYQDQFLKILSEPKENRHHPLKITFSELTASCSGISNDVLVFPSVVLPACERAVSRALTFCYNNADDKTTLIEAKHVHPRFCSMPRCWNRYMRSFPGTEELGRYFTVVGTVVRCSDSKALEFAKFYECSSCKGTMIYESSPTTWHYFPKNLDQCKNKCTKGKVQVCEAKNSESEVFRRYRDYQEVKIQESVAQMEFGIMPKTMVVILENDLVSSVKPGDEVEITGVLFHRCAHLKAGKEIQVGMAFRANSVQVLNATENLVRLDEETVQLYEGFWERFKSNPFAGQNLIVKSVCPELYGMYIVKLSLLLTLAGGVQTVASDATNRGDSHLLLVGDSGTGKSRLLTYAAKLFPRAVMTTGTGATSAGMTVAAVNDKGNWSLEGGALVMADGGLCCIDDFLNIGKEHLACIHEVMEQQTISVAKAGITSKLNCKCIVIAAANSNAISRKSKSSEVDLSSEITSPLLSRFDLVVTLRDTKNSQWDESITQHILKSGDPYRVDQQGSSEGDKIWDMNMLRTYLMLIRDTKKPELADGVFDVLTEYYKRHRLAENRNKGRSSRRLFSGLCRLTQAHAKVMYRDVTEMYDAVTTIMLIESSMGEFALFDKQPPKPLHTNFPEDPMRQYAKEAEFVLTELGFPGLWATEKAYLQSLQ